MKRLIVLLLSAVALYGATTISGTYHDANGNATNCRVKITPSLPFRSASTNIVNKTVNANCDTSGVISVQLEPTEGANPANVYYQVEVTTGTATYTQKWAVPNVSGTVDVGSVLITSSPGPKFRIPISQLDASTMLDGTYCLSVIAGQFSVVRCTGGSGGPQTWDGLESFTFGQLEAYTWGQLETKQ